MFHLVCTIPFDRYTKGQSVTDPSEVDRLSHDRGHHFVRIAAPPEPEVEVSESPATPVSLDDEEHS